jgi:hypothetical protein
MVRQKTAALTKHPNRRRNDMLTKHVLACTGHEGERWCVAGSDRSHSDLVAEDGDDNTFRRRGDTCLGIVEFNKFKSVLLGEGSEQTEGVVLCLLDGRSANEC